MYVGKYPAFCICCLILNLNYAIHRRSWLVNGFFSLFLFAASQFSRFVYIGRTCLCGIHYISVSGIMDTHAYNVLKHIYIL